MTGSLAFVFHALFGRHPERCHSESRRRRRISRHSESALHSRGFLASLGMTKGTGSFALILHAHLPFVRHPEHEFFREENWLFEAISESYVPLLQMIRRLLRRG